MLAHAIGPHSNVANGIVNAIVLPFTMHFNAPEASEQYATIVRGLAGDFPLGAHSVEPIAAINAIQALLGRLSIPARLRDIGVTRDDLPGIANAAMSDWFITRNIRASSLQSIESILADCW